MTRAKVNLTPLGNKIKYRITGKVVCSRSGGELSNSGTYDKTDTIWRSVIGGPVAIGKFLKRNRVVNKVMFLEDLGYDNCDTVT